VNSFGKVTAVAPGTVYISAFAGEISTKIQIIVEAEKSVTSIDVSDFKNEMKVGETQTITTSLFPADAENQNIQFYSSNSNVATVSNSGFITAIAKGTTTISIYCGSASRFLHLTVYVPTEEIKLSESFVVLRPKETYQIDAIVMPEDASREIIYKSTNPSVATVSANGLISSIAPGNASIVLQNHDSMKSITIIVNEHGKATGETEMDEIEIGDGSSRYSDIVVNMIEKCADGETIIVHGADYSFVTTEVLQLLYNTNKVLLIQYDNYTLEILGEKVRNPHNGFPSQLQLLDTKKGLEFEIDNATALPGEINIHFEELDKTYKYLYLYNEVSEKYEKLNELSQQEAKINIAGKYLITTQKIRSFNIPTLFIIAGGTLLTAGTTIYIVTKKKYLFW